MKSWLTFLIILLTAFNSYAAPKSSLSITGFSKSKTISKCQGHKLNDKNSANFAPSCNITLEVYQSVDINIKNTSAITAFNISANLSGLTGVTQTLTNCSTVRGGQTCIITLSVKYPITPQREIFIQGTNTTQISVLLTVNSAYAYAYIATEGINKITLCTVNSSSGFNTCLPTGQTISGPSDIIINPTKTIAYITQVGGFNVYICAIDSNNGALITPCATQTINTSLSRGNFNPAGTLLYIVSSFDGTNRYTVASGGALNLVGTQNILSAPDGITFNNSGSMAYIAQNNANTVAICDVDGLTGALTCSQDSTPYNFTFSTDVLLDASNSLAYVLEKSGNISACSLGGTGLFTGCQAPVSVGTGQFNDLNYNINGDKIYITSPNLNSVYSCDVSGSTISNCGLVQGGLSGARAIRVITLP